MSWIILTAALVFLDASLTFENLWPTPGVLWRGALSIELAACVLLLAAAHHRLGRASRPSLNWLATAWTVLVLGRYAEVTAPALYGRDINLYWDLRFIPDVVAMVTRVAPIWLTVLAVAAIALVLAIVFLIVHSALARVAAGMVRPRERRVLIAASAAAACLFAAQLVGPRVPRTPAFASPVTQTYARQLLFVADALTGSTALAASPPMNSDLSLVKGADVFLVFMESYGAVSYDRPEIAAALVESRLQFSAAIRETNRDVVSAYVESPTFGGSSWLAHLSLMTGIEVRDPETNAKLMTERRDTLPRAFRRHGFRTVAVMPGLKHPWPEGAFYGFDQIYGSDQLAYHGPPFGWFAIPDQFSIDKLDALEVSRPERPPLFVFFPTVSTHFPFIPTPPYQPDWGRMKSDRPYDRPEMMRAYSQQPDWTDFTPGYVQAMTYDYASVAGYLRRRSDRDIVMIVLGDHQPPGAVSGNGAPWDVPVHVIASRKDVLDRLVARGFQAGLSPVRPALGRMNDLLPLLLQAFGDGM